MCSTEQNAPADCFITIVTHTHDTRPLQGRGPLPEGGGLCLFGVGAARTFLLLCVGLSLGFGVVHVQGDTGSHIALTDEERTWIAQHPTVRVGFDDSYAPFEFTEDGRHQGLSAEYLAILSERVGLEFEMVDSASWGGVLDKAREGSVDLLPTAVPTDERSAYLTFTEPYESFGAAIITSLNETGTLDVNDLAGKRVAVVRGYFWEDLLRKDHPEIDLYEVDDLGTGLQEVAFGRADAFFATYAAASYYLNEHGISNLRVAGMAPYPVRMAMAVRKDLPELATILDKGLASITPDEKDIIRGHWITLRPISDFRVERLLEAFKWSVFLFLLIVLVGGVWNYLLRRQVREKTEKLRERLEHGALLQGELMLSQQTLEARVEERTSELLRLNHDLERSRCALSLANRRFRDLANEDSLTEIANRRRFDETYAETVRNAQRERKPVSVLLIDVDDFKAYNDLYGHQGGDECLHALGQCLAMSARRNGEFVARYGGEEFVAVLLGDVEEARAFGRFLIESLRGLRIPHQTSTVDSVVTVSVGIASGVPSLDGDFKGNLLRRADAALYRAKRAGKNRLESDELTFDTKRASGVHRFV